MSAAVDLRPARLLEARRYLTHVGLIAAADLLRADRPPVAAVAGGADAAAV